MRGPSDVIATVCSKCADMEPSAVRIVQPSSIITTMSEPAVIIGSIAMVIPSDRRGPRPGSPKFGNVRILVVVAADAVPDEAADDGEPRSLDELLDRMRDVSDPVPDDRVGDSRGERVLGDVEQSLILLADRPHAERVRAVGDVAVERDADVDRHEVAVADDELVGDSVNDDVVGRDADRLGVALVALGGRYAALLADEVACGVVELVRRDARTKQRADVGDRLGDEHTRRGDLLDLALALADDHRLATTPTNASWIDAKTSSTVCSPSTATSVPTIR